jgi:hypothetical protein
VSSQPEEKQLVVEDARTVRIRVNQAPAKNGFCFRRSCRRGLFMRSCPDYHGNHSALSPMLVTVRAGPSNGAATTAWTSLPSLTTTMAKFTNPPVLGRI